MDLIKYSTQDVSYQEINSVKKVLKSDYLTTGPILNKFEEKLSKYFNVKYTSAISSATAGLHLSCLALGLKKNDIFWTTPITFVASANCGIYCGAKLDLVDIDDQTYLISLDKLKKKLIEAKKQKKLPKILITVHLSGHSCNMREIKKLSRIYKFKIIEDASHCMGAKYQNKKIGSCEFSDISVFSFHPVKIITTAEGGAVCTNNKKIYQKINVLRSHGIFRDTNKKFKWHYDQKILGYNYRINEIQAAIGLQQLKKVNKFVKKRNEIAKFYKKELKNLPIKFQQHVEKSFSSYHLFIIRVNKKIRNNLNQYLNQKKIQTNLHYIPIYRHAFYKKFLKKKLFPNSEKYYEEAITIPLHTKLNKNQLIYIMKHIKYFFKKK